LGPFTFEFIFGSKEWGRAGEIAFLLIPAVFSHFCIFPLSPIFIVLEKQYLLFLLDTLRMIFIFLCFYIPHKLNLEPQQAILFYSFATAFIYFLIFFVSVFEIKKKTKSFS
jgi:O-antigen/teichoic acid export membrane protein